MCRDSKVKQKLKEANAAAKAAALARLPQQKKVATSARQCMTPEFTSQRTMMYEM